MQFDKESVRHLRVCARLTRSIGTCSPATSTCGLISARFLKRAIDLRNSYVKGVGDVARASNDRQRDHDSSDDFDGEARGLRAPSTSSRSLSSASRLCLAWQVEADRLLDDRRRKASIIPSRIVVIRYAGRDQW
jgi:hypothetical protein